MKQVRYLLEGVLWCIAMGFFRLLPLDIASALGGMLGRMVGKLAPHTAIARRNLQLAFPEKSAAEHESIIGGMWENLGRNMAELPHYGGKKILKRIQLEELQHMPAPGNATLFFSGHLGNWELLSSVAYDQGVPVILIYRHLNNPYVDDFVARIRANHCSGLIPKGPKGAVHLARALKSKKSLAMLVDQKMNEGIAVPFFGRDAMTAPAVAKLALKFKLPITPARIVRVKGAHFRGVLCPRLQFMPTGDEERDTLHIMTLINQQLERWIRETPEQWFWVHRRWPNI